MDPTRLLFPALRWSDDTGYGHDSVAVKAVLERGVGGFILFGGSAEAAARTVAELQAASPHALLFGADLERGAGQQFDGCTSLPPAAALGGLDPIEDCRRAGATTAREARAIGVGWVFAPVADLDVEPRNPIVGTRAFGADSEDVAEAVISWVMGCESAGALACAKHFPGHGRTRTDSHQELPVVRRDRELLTTDLLPFATAIEVGLSSVMTAHVAYPDLDPSGTPATRSRPIISELLRETLEFDGLVVTDALIMAAAAGSRPGEDGAESGATGALEALDAGVDALLYPRDPLALSDRLRAALAAGRLDGRRVSESVERIKKAAERTAGARGAWGLEEDRVWAEETARRSLRWIRRPRKRLEVERRVLHVVDDDLGGPYAPPSRVALLDGLGRSQGSPGASPGSLAVFCDPRGWKGRAGLSEEAKRTVARRAPDAEVVLLFGHPRLAADVPGDAPLLCAWGGEGLMQEAAIAEVRRWSARR